jgi:hypothetical protein
VRGPRSVRRASRDGTAGEAGTLAVEGESARIDRGGGSRGVEAVSVCVICKVQVGRDNRVRAVLCRCVWP